MTNVRFGYGVERRDWFELTCAAAEARKEAERHAMADAGIGCLAGQSDDHVYCSRLTLRLHQQILVE